MRLPLLLRALLAHSSAAKIAKDTCNYIYKSFMLFLIQLSDHHVSSTVHHLQMKRLFSFIHDVQLQSAHMDACVKSQRSRKCYW